MSVVRLDTPMTKAQIIRHLQHNHSQAVAHLGKAGNGEDHIVTAALHGLSKADLIDLHRLVHVAGLGH